jgi:hypothetical protein
MNQVWIVLVLIRERRLAMQKSKKHDPAIAHILAFCLVNFRPKKTNHGPFTLHWPTRALRWWALPDPVKKKKVWMKQVAISASYSTPMTSRSSKSSSCSKDSGSELTRVVLY